ncbi:MAG TPA: hypothetical protein VF006_05210 [Longimicrobium sp.]
MRLPNKRGLAAALACVVMHAPATPAQIEAEPSPRGFCWTGRPAESCRTFLVAEGGAYTAVASTRYTRRGFDRRVTRSMHLTGHAGWEVGMMRNVSPRDAVGAAVLAGGDANGERIALKGRYRRWTGRSSAMDVGAGVMFARRAEPHPDPDTPGNLHVPVAGLTGDVSLGLTDWVGVSVRGDLLYDQDGRPATGVYGGLKLGTRPALVATALPLVLGMIAFVVFAGSGG